jgi:hypothetical protein
VTHEEEVARLREVRRGDENARLGIELRAQQANERRRVTGLVEP